MNITGANGGELYDRGEQLKAGFLRQHSVILVRLCSLLDALVIFLSLFAALWFYNYAWLPEHLVAGLLAALIYEILASFFDLYRSWRVIRLRYEVMKILLYWATTLIFLTFVLFVSENKHSIDKYLLLTWFLLAFLVMCAVHCSVRIITRYARALGFDVRKVAFIGASDIAIRMKTIFSDHPWMGMNSIGVYDNRSQNEDGRISMRRDEVKGTVEDLVELAKDCEVDIVYICLPLAAEKRIKTFIDQFSDTTVSIYYCPSFFNFDLMNSRWDEVFGQPIISIVESPFVDNQRYLKRLEDIAISLLAMPIIIPLIAVIGMLVKLSSKGPVLFKQNRYGINGKSFKMLKFRSMYIEQESKGFVQATRMDPRVTPFGAFLRSTSLDEIPQFFNVLMGDMSVVGPRPHPDTLNEDLRKRIHRYMLRHKIKPGITGLAQVSGFRGETQSLDKMEQRIEQDLEYIRHWSLWLDLKILVKTFFSLRGNNVY
ncbi:MAG: undecaprenyl-phosphate glucose phosphotransferase [Halioglobus sp.]